MGRNNRATILIDHGMIFHLSSILGAFNTRIMASCHQSCHEHFRIQIFIWALLKIVVRAPHFVPQNNAK